MEKISVIIVNWNVTESLNKCLESIFACKYTNLEIIVIDNNSKDLEIRLIRSIRLIKNTSNVGFPKAVNQGLKIATGDFLLLLNPDTRIPTDFFTKSIDFYKKFPTAGLMGPKFVDPDGSPQGSVFDEPSIFYSRQKYTPNTEHLTPIIVNAISGGCMFFPRSTFNKLGFLTEEVFMYYEDLDYCRRARNAGLKVYFNPQISIIHEHGKSSVQNSSSYKYLVASSIWYNGPLKHYLMWCITRANQKFHQLLGRRI